MPIIRLPSKIRTTKLTTFVYQTPKGEVFESETAYSEENCKLNHYKLIGKFTRELEAPQKEHYNETPTKFFIVPSLNSNDNELPNLFNASVGMFTKFNHAQEIETSTIPEGYLILNIEDVINASLKLKNQRDYTCRDFARELGLQ